MSDDLEFSISQYLDGTLVGDERAALEARLASDAGARALLEEYRGVDVALQALPGLPAVRWDALAERISGAVDALEEPAQSYPMSRYRLTRWIAVAASVVIGAGVAFQMLRPGPSAQDDGTGTGIGPTAPAVLALRIVDEPTTDTAPAAAASPVVVTIGPSERLRKEPTLRRYSDDVVSRPSQVIIASSFRPADDTAGGGPF